MTTQFLLVSLPPLMAKQNLYVAGEGALFQGGSGNDTIANYTGKFSANTIKGGAGNDLITFAHQPQQSLFWQVGGRATGSAGTFTAIYAVLH